MDNLISICDISEKFRNSTLVLIWNSIKMVGDPKTYNPYLSKLFILFQIKHEKVYLKQFPTS